MAISTPIVSSGIEYRVEMLTRKEFDLHAEGNSSPDSALEKWASQAIYPTRQDFFNVLQRLGDAVQEQDNEKRPVFSAEVMDESFFEEIEDEGLTERQAAVLGIALNYKPGQLKKLAVKGHVDFDFDATHALWKKILASENISLPLSDRIRTTSKNAATEEVGPYLASSLTHVPVPRKKIEPLPFSGHYDDDDTVAETRPVNAIQPSRFRKTKPQEESNKNEPSGG